MNQNNPDKFNEVMEKQRAAFLEKQKQEGFRQITAFVLFAFIAYLLMGFNSNWIFGITFPPLYATLLSFVFMRVAIPLAILGYCLQQIGVILPIFPLSIS